MEQNILKKHKVNIRIYYGDTDCGKVVYYANYLKYFEIGRTEFMRDNGIELEEYHNRGIIFIVVSNSIEYKYSAKYNDTLTIYSQLLEYSKKTFTIANEIFNQDGRLVVKGFTKCACVNSESKLASIPENIISVFKRLTLNEE